MKTIFLFLKNPLFISDLLRTDYIQYLSGKYRVVVFTSAVSESSGGNRYFSGSNVEYVPWRLQSPKLSAAFKRLRGAALHELDYLTGVSVYYESQAFLADKRARLLRVLSYPFAPLLTVDTLTKLEALLTSASPLFNSYVARYRPALVMTATPGIQVFDAEAIILAKKAGVPTLATNFSWDNLTGFKAVRIRKPDYLFVWNDLVREAAVSLHRFDPKRVFVTGSTRFDRYFTAKTSLPSREQFLKSKNLDPSKKTILFATVGTKHPFEIDFIRALLQARTRRELPETNILIRLHPFDKIERYGEFRDLSNVRVEPAGKRVETGKVGITQTEIDDDDFANLKATLMYTDININYKSTISLESCLFGKPVINFIDPTKPFQNRYYYEEASYYRPLVKYGAVRVVRDRKELLLAVRTYLDHPERDRGNRDRVADLYIPYRDGLSYKRAVDFIARII